MRLVYTCLISFSSIVYPCWNDGGRPPSRPITIPDDPSCYVKSKVLPEGEIKCGIKGAYKTTKLKFGQTGLFDPNNKDRFSDGNIVFGDIAKHGEFPWQISIRPKSGWMKGKNNCGGTIIDSETIVTAAHCFWKCPLINRDIDKCRFENFDNFYKNEIPNGWIKDYDSFAIAIGFEKSFGGNKSINEQDAKKFGIAMKQINLKKKMGSVVIHPKYAGTLAEKDLSGYHLHDIAIIKLDSPINFPKNSDAIRSKPNKNEPIGTFVRPVCLPLPSGDVQPVPIEPWNKETEKSIMDSAASLVITGFGKTQNQKTCRDENNVQVSCKQSNGEAILGDAAQDLRYGNVAYMESGTCTEKLIPYWEQPKYRGKYKGMQVSDGQICAKSKPSAVNATDACQGDSGGPMIFGLTGHDLHLKRNPGKNFVESMADFLVSDPDSGTRKWTLAGVVSWGFECGLNIPAMYTRVSHYMDFILEHAKAPQTMEGQILQKCDE